MHISAVLFLLSATGTLARPAVNPSIWEAVLDGLNSDRGDNSGGGSQGPASPDPAGSPNSGPSPATGGQDWSSPATGGQDWSSPPTGGQGGQEWAKRDVAASGVTDYLRGMQYCSDLNPDLDAWGRKKLPGFSYLPVCRPGTPPRTSRRSTDETTPLLLPVEEHPDGIAIHPDFLKRLDEASAEHATDRNAQPKPVQARTLRVGNALPYSMRQFLEALRRKRQKVPHTPASTKRDGAMKLGPGMGGASSVGNPDPASAGNAAMNAVSQLHSRDLSPEQRQELLEKLRDLIKWQVPWKAIEMRDLSPEKHRELLEKISQLIKWQFPWKAIQTRSLKDLMERIKQTIKVPLPIHSRSEKPNMEDVRNVFEKIKLLLKWRILQPSDLQTRSVVESSDILDKYPGLAEKIRQSISLTVPVQSRDIGRAFRDLFRKLRDMTKKHVQRRSIIHLSEFFRELIEKVKSLADEARSEKRDGVAAAGEDAFVEAEITNIVLEELLDAGYSAEEITNELTVMPDPVAKRDENDAVDEDDEITSAVIEPLLAEGYTLEQIAQELEDTPAPVEKRDEADDILDLVGKVSMTVIGELLFRGHRIEDIIEQLKNKID